MPTVNGKLVHPQSDLVKSRVNGKRVDVRRESGVYRDPRPNSPISQPAPFA